MVRHSADLSLGGRLRPFRFAIPMPIEFRDPEEPEWLVGQIDNVSRSGILFHTSSPVSADRPIEMKFELPAEAGGEEGALVLCMGEVVRLTAGPTPESPCTVAARIVDYHFLRSADFE